MERAPGGIDREDVLTAVDLTGVPPGRMGEAGRVAITTATRSMSLAEIEKGLPLRATLIQAKTTESTLVLVWSPHHVEGNSAPFACRHIQEIYRSGAHPPLSHSESVSPIPPSPGAVSEKDLEFWRERLRRIPSLDLPASRKLPVTPSPAFTKLPPSWASCTSQQEESEGREGGGRGCVAVQLSSATVRQLHELAGQQGCTAGMLLLAAFAGLLHVWSGQLRVVIGTDMGSQPRRRRQVSFGFSFFLGYLSSNHDL